MVIHDDDDAADDYERYLIYQYAAKLNSWWNKHMKLL